MISWFSVKGQELIPLGQWRSHFNYNEARLVAATDSKIFCATTTALFSFDRSDNSLNRLTKVQGFSDIAISALSYSRETNWLIIGYSNGNLDFFDGSEIVNFPVILQEPIVGSKQINKITTNGNLAYLATDFGVVVIDLEKIEVVETYENLSPTGETTAINDLAVFGDQLFLATNFGVISGSITGEVNLLDFRNWARYESSPVGNQPINFVVSSEDNVIGSTESNLYSLENGDWNELNINPEDEILNLSLAGGDLLLLSENSLSVVSLANNLEEIVQYIPTPKPADALVDDQGTFWIADKENGLNSWSNGNSTGFRLSGPATNTTFRLFYHDEKIYALPGGFNSAIRPLNNFEGYSIFENGNWTIVETDELPFGNLTAMEVDPSNQDVWITSFGDGLLNLSNQSIINANSSGSLLQSADTSERSTQVTGIGFDSQGNRWLANHNSTRPLIRIDQEGNWSSFNFDPSASRFPISLTINELDDVWMRLSPNEGGGIFVFNEQVENGEQLLTTGENAGNLPNENVTSVVFDREGQVWIGTVQGIAFLPNPLDVFNETGFDVVRPVFENRPLLEDEYITALAVDGGNRKWIGTKIGLWLFEEAGDELVRNFTATNSPLPSNVVIDIEVHDKTGEVFISTDKGMVSFRSDATLGTKKHSKVKVFPNPVRPGFTGQIGISGLAEDATIKITDIGGRLVRETEANGGNASWDARDFSGNRVSTGIYLIFSASPDGDESFVGKIAVVR